MHPTHLTLRHLAFACIAASLLSPALGSDSDFFETEVRPLLVAKCFACHSDATEEPGGDLRLDSAESIDHGGVVIAGDPENSLLFEAISYESGLDMPPDGKLKPSEIKILRQWITEGAHFPEIQTVEGFDLAHRRANHWAWRSLPKDIPLPEVAPAKENSPPSEARQPLDTFVEAKLREVDLSFAAPVNRAALLRRLHFVLIGLPPTPAQVDEFVQDERPDATRRVVDRLLADPQFGVRWGRHWLDLVRYAETYGHEFDYAIPQAWQYRDYVIEALNGDLPFDQFAMEQLAGDLMSSPRIDPVDQSNRSIVGSGFWWLGEAVHAPVDVLDDQAIRIDNQIDVASKTFLGMTVACARCHDHKFDAISQADYYAMVGLLQSTTRSVGWLDSNQQFDEWMKSCQQAAENLQRSVSTSASFQHDATINSETLTWDGDASRLFDFSNGWPTGSTTEGWAFRESVDPQHPTAIVVQGDSEEPVVIETHPSGWLDSRELGPQARGIWRSPAFVIEQPHLIYQVAGDGQAEIRLVVDGYFMKDYHSLLFKDTRFQPKSPNDAKAETWTWHVQSGDLHHYVGHTAHLEVVDSGAGWVGLASVYQSPTPQIPMQSAVPVTFQSLDDLATSRNLFDQESNSRTRLTNKIERSSMAPADAVEHYFEITRRPPEKMPTTVLRSAPLQSRDAALAVRGNVHEPGPKIPRGDLTALSIDARNESDVDAESTADGTKSPSREKDRLDLARGWASPDNPLFARVAVNRLWHHVQGQGLVTSCDNFGVLGQRPTHPQLLDHLARDFAENGWSSKRMIRSMLLSRTFASESKTDQRVREIDPVNEWLSHAPIRRLEGEAIRDSLLAISGRMNRALGGRSTPIYLDAFMTGRGRPGKSGPLDGEGRRSIFIEVRRNFLSPFLMAFDTPQPSTTVGRRNRSNVPAQALAMLNDPLVDQLLDRWIANLPEDPGTVEDIVDRLYRECFARSPRKDEMEAAVAFIRQSDNHQQAVRDLADVLVNTKEFIHVP